MFVMVGDLEVYSPISEVNPKGFVPSRRPTNLQGKRIGLWWNEKAKGDIALRTIERELAKRYPDAEFVWFEYMYPTPAQAYEEVRGAKLDLIIGATAD